MQHPKILIGKKGFTVIELLVVLLIIGILAAVILVNIAGQTKRAARAGAIQSIRSAMPPIAACLMRGFRICNTVGSVGGGDICKNGLCSGNAAPGFESFTWPILPEGFSYSTLDSIDLGVDDIVAKAPAGQADVSCSSDTGSCSQ